MAGCLEGDIQGTLGLVCYCVRLVDANLGPLCSNAVAEKNWDCESGSVKKALVFFEGNGNGPEMPSKTRIFRLETSLDPFFEMP
jgi:hypothetical protein